MSAVVGDRYPIDAPSTVFKSGVYIRHIFLSGVTGMASDFFRLRTMLTPAPNVESPHDAGQAAVSSQFCRALSTGSASLALAVSLTPFQPLAVVAEVLPEALQVEAANDLVEQSQLGEVSLAKVSDSAEIALEVPAQAAAPKAIAAPAKLLAWAAEGSISDAFVAVSSTSPKTFPSIEASVEPSQEAAPQIAVATIDADRYDAVVKVEPSSQAKTPASIDVAVASNIGQLATTAQKTSPAALAQVFTPDSRVIAPPAIASTPQLIAAEPSESLQLEVLPPQAQNADEVRSRLVPGSQQALPTPAQVAPIHSGSAPNTVMPASEFGGAFGHPAARHDAAVPRPNGYQVAQAYPQAPYYPQAGYPQGAYPQAVAYPQPYPQPVYYYPQAVAQPGYGVPQGYAPYPQAAAPYYPQPYAAPQAGYPQPVYPQQAYPQQGYAQPVYPQQGYIAQPYPQYPQPYQVQPYANQGYAAAPNYPAPASPYVVAQPYPPQAYPAQNYAAQPYPQPGYGGYPAPGVATAMPVQLPPLPAPGSAAPLPNNLGNYSGGNYAQVPGIPGSNVPGYGTAYANNGYGSTPYNSNRPSSIGGQPELPPPPSLSVGDTAFALPAAPRGLSNATSAAVPPQALSGINLNRLPQIPTDPALLEVPSTLPVAADRIPAGIGGPLDFEAPTLELPPPPLQPRQEVNLPVGEPAPILRSTALRQPDSRLQAVFLSQGNDSAARARLSGIYPLTPNILFGASFDVASGEGFTDTTNGFSVNEAFASTSLAQLPNLRIVAGQMDLTSYFDRNSFAKDSATHFFNPVFQTNPALSAVGLGSRPGILGNWSATDNLDLKVAAYSSSDSIGEFALDGFAGEVGFRKGNAIVRATYASGRDDGSRDSFQEIFNIDRGDGRSGVLEGDREEAYGVNGEVFIPSLNAGVFGRYGRYENRDLGESGDTYSLGLSFLDVFTDEDRLGVAFGRNISNDDLRRRFNEDTPNVLELFYDFRFLPNLRMGFTIQERDSFSELAAGFRLKAEFDTLPAGKLSEVR